MAEVIKISLCEKYKFAIISTIIYVFVAMENIKKIFNESPNYGIPPINYMVLIRGKVNITLVRKYHD